MPILDGFRGLAIIPVLIYHFSNLYPPDRHSIDLTIYSIFKAGWVGVDLFFVLSGFLITGILVDTRNATNHFSAFYGRRVLRIFPLYYMALVVLFLVLPAVSSRLADVYARTIQDQAWFWLYASNWYFAKEGGIGNTPGGYFWSLAVEEQFYLVWPFMIYHLSGRRLMYFTLCVFFLSPTIRLILLSNGYSAAAVYCMTVTHMEGLAIGSFIAVMLRSGVFEFDGVSVAALRLACGVIIALLVGFSVKFGNFYFWEDWVAGVPLTALSVLFASLLLLLVNARPDSLMFRFFDGRVLRSFGNLSYALYVIHVPLGRLLHISAGAYLKKLSLGSTLLERSMFIAVAIAITYALAFLSWHLFEKQVLKLKKYFNYAYPQ
jgi:peptidoglycan/LPS O-acetylase OafA/YrhL